MFDELDWNEKIKGDTGPAARGRTSPTSRIRGKCTCLTPQSDHIVDIMASPMNSMDALPLKGCDVIPTAGTHVKRFD